MTVEALDRSSATGEERLRSRALDLLRTTTLEVVLEAAEPLRTADLARLVGERLALRLTDEEQGGLASLVRLVLDSDPLYSQANRQWDLALRMGRAEGDRRKPVERSLEDFIDLIGHPVTAKPISVLAAAVYGRLPDYYEKMLSRIAPTSQHFFVLNRNEIAISRWLIDISSDEAEDVEYDNFPDTTVVRVLKDVAREIQADDALDFAVELIERAGEPVDGRALQFVTWSTFPDIEPEELFAELYEHSGVSLERGPAWVTQDGHAQVLDTLRAIFRSPENLTDLVAASVPSDDEELGILAPTTARVSDDDLDQVIQYMEGEERTYRLGELLQHVLEAFPGSRTYADIQESLRTRMSEDPRVLWVGFERFRVAGTVPADADILPESFTFDEDVYLGEDGEEIDRAVDVSEWKPGLEEQIQHYLVQDIGDDDTVAGPAPKSLVSSPPLHQYIAGVRYLRLSERNFFPASPDLVQVTLIAPDDSRFDVWVNNRLGLLTGLKEWYDANLPWVGGQFTLEPTAQPEEYALKYSGEVEPLMNVPLDRLQQLLALRGEAATERLPLSEIVLRILKAHPEGIHFVTLFTEVNVVRRTRRSTLASILSGQRYFSQTGAETAIWIFDEKRAAKTRGKKKAGPRRVREWDDDDDNDEEFEID
jgi:hypothetical protein